MVTLPIQMNLLCLCYNCWYELLQTTSNINDKIMNMYDNLWIKIFIIIILL